MALSEWDEYFKESKGKESFGGDAPPAGTYIVEFLGVRCTQTSAGDDMVIFPLEVLTGPYQGHRFNKREIIRQASNVDFLKGDLEALGIKLDRLSDLPNAHGTIAGRCAEVQVVWKEYKGKMYDSCYIQKQVDVPGGPPKRPSPPQDGTPTHAPTPDGHPGKINLEEQQAAAAEFDRKTRDGTEEPIVDPPRAGRGYSPPAGSGSSSSEEDDPF